MFIGIDIGGTNIRVARFNSLEQPVIIARRDMLDSPSYETNEAHIIQAIHELGSPVEGIGIGTPGRLNAERTAITHTHMIPQWLGHSLVETLQATFHCPVHMEGDQYCSALSEMQSNERHDDFYLLGYGTGIGCARVTYIDGEPRIQTFSSEEHAIYLKPWQEACSGKWVQETYGKPMAALSEAEWDQIMMDFYGYFVTFVTELNPPRIVLGSGIAVKQWSRLEQVFTKFKTHYPNYAELEISLAHDGENAGVIGAVRLLSQD